MTLGSVLGGSFTELSSVQGWLQRQLQGTGGGDGGRRGPEGGRRVPQARAQCLSCTRSTQGRGNGNNCLVLPRNSTSYVSGLTPGTSHV